MRNYSKTVSGPVMAGIAGIAVATFVPAGADHALANGGKAKRTTSASTGGAPVYTTEHQSTLRLTERDSFPLHRGIKLGRNKSMMIEVPRELRDVIVSNPEMMDAVVQSSNRVYLIGKKNGQSNVFFFDVNGEQIATFEVVIEYDTAVLDALFQRLMPGSQIKVEILNETVILTGSVRNPADSSRAGDIASRFIVQPSGETDVRHQKKVINLLQIEGEEQVMLRVTVAEVERTILKQFGINIGAVINSGNFSTAILTENALPLTAALGLGKLPIPGINLDSAATACAAGRLCNYNSGPAASTFGNSGVAGGAIAGQSSFSHAMRMMERNGLIKTLAEPNLTAISGETAKFLAGGEFPVPVSVNTGQLGIQFKEFGVGVAFTPVVLSEGRINLKIETEVSELTDAGSISISGFQLPALKKRQAKSTVELPSGGTLAMAGLLSDDTRKNIDGFPGLKDLPVLGTLFRSQDFVKRETELVIMVTPYIVRPVARQNLARPTDGLAPASDLKTNVLGHMNRVYGKKADQVVNGGIKDGQIGFIVD